MRRALHVLAGLAVCGALYAFAAVATQTLPFGPFLAACLAVAAAQSAADWFGPDGPHASRRRRRRTGSCARCGYNLTGNVSGTCPECGAATTPVARARTVS